MGRGWGTPEERGLGSPLEELGCTWTKGLGPQWSTPDPADLRDEAVGTSRAAHQEVPWFMSESGVDMDTLLYLQQITNKDLLYSTGNFA